MKHNIHSQHTKTILAKTLLSLLEKKSLSKITVSELVTLCEINRKTFYYHFADVYALFEWYLNEEIQKAIDTVNPLKDINATITYSIEYMNKNPYLYNSIDNPIGRDKITRFLNKQIYPTVCEILTEMEKQYQKELEVDFKEFLAKNLTRVTVLTIIDAIENPDALNAERMKLYLSDVFHASLAGFFKNYK